MKNESILNSIKTNIGMDEAYSAFDNDILVIVNSCFSTLNQLGVGPDIPLHISSTTNQWSEFTEDPALRNYAEHYITLKTRILFDPPVNSFTLEALKTQASELEWRISIMRGEPNE